MLRRMIDPVCTLFKLRECVRLRFNTYQFSEVTVLLFHFHVVRYFYFGINLHHSCKIKCK